MDGGNTMNDDSTLLRRFAARRDEDAFAELVGRHLGLVYHAALRQTGGVTQLAEDAAQATFSLLAAKAAKLAEHPELAGWLYTTACHKARELRRGEQRRRQREHTASTMQDLHAEPTNDEAWRRMRPVIDDALLGLAPEDRAAVVLRFFEGRAFAEIGVALRVGENAARMRVERALDRLQGALERRGLTSTAATLATALAVPAALATPAGLAGRIAGNAFAAATAGATAGGLLHFMISAKTLVPVTALVAVAAVGTSVHQQRELAALRTVATDLRRENAALQARLDPIESHHSAATAPTASVSAPSSATAASAPAGGASADEPISQQSVDARYKRAKELARNGQYAEALAEFLWCYDKGMKLIASFAGVRNSYLTDSIAKLAKVYPPALVALQERRDAAERRIVADPAERDAVLDYCALNRALDENDRSLVVFDTISAGDERRSFLAYSLIDPLIEARRYSELLAAYPYSRIRSLFEATSDPSRLAQVVPAQIDLLRRTCVRLNAKQVEVLAGAGDLADAREFIGKILAFDSTYETRTLLQRHLERAGHPELLPP